ncbi:MAG: DNA-processing protein DprA [Eubacterium sp.]|nr:DNA-processing protein DprA [Eubacterium sp.]MDD7208806.1 DNA-processing protein DprA [Lachnospiraceae bacterium]MDY5498353.1 DNA-processing protein DprA [Anaerobutyricum sp.]
MEWKDNQLEHILYDIWLTKIKGLGPIKQRSLLKKYRTAQDVFYAKEAELSAIRELTGEDIKQILGSRELDAAKEILEKCMHNEIKVVTLEDSQYPYLAREIPDMPILLYCKGILRENICGNTIVGSRRCSKEGKEKTAALSKKLVQEGKTIISGMAKGIDSYAHTACIRNGGYTIAVLGNGLDICYPKEHNLLMKRIEENGLLVSEYEPGVPPSKYRFPRRNRIMAAMADEIYVTEAGRGSGALITADFGRKYGRKVHIL